jgi:hypothetical protein
MILAEIREEIQSENYDVFFELQNRNSKTMKARYILNRAFG